MFQQTITKLETEFSGSSNEGLREEILSRLRSYEQGVCPIPHASNLVTALFDGFALTPKGKAKREAVLEVFAKELHEFTVDALRLANARREGGRKGDKSKSAENGKKGGRPRKT